MPDFREAPSYPPLEEAINVLTHAIALILSVVAVVLLVVHAARHGDARHVVSAAVFGASLTALYAASTLYHSATSPRLRRAMRIVDHTAIYLLIAGTYTPFALVTLPPAIGWVIFGLSWGMALVGIILKLFFTGKCDRLSTVMYVAMGWTIAIAAKPLMANLSTSGLLWLLAGGVCYTLGAVLYSVRRLVFNHAIFHTLVVMGSICHFVSVFSHVLPGA